MPRIVSGKDSVDVHVDLIEIGARINESLTRLHNYLQGIIYSSIIKPKTKEDLENEKLLKQATEIIKNGPETTKKISKGLIAGLATASLIAGTVSLSILDFLFSSEDEDENEEQQEDKQQPRASSQDRGSVNEQLAAGDVGALSEQYEAGKRGSYAIGYDTSGGTSYGKYQLASKRGTMDTFVNWVKRQGDKGAEIARRLEAAKPYDTGSTKGLAPQVWKELVNEGYLDGELEKMFVEYEYYEKSLKGLKPEVLKDSVAKSTVLKSVLWSTSVNHGQGTAAKLFNKSYSPGISVGDFIQNVYNKRIQFVRNHPDSESLQNRYVNENSVALSTLDSIPNANFTMATGGMMGDEIKTLVLPLNSYGSGKIIDAVTEACSNLNRIDRFLDEYEEFFGSKFVPQIGKIFGEALREYHGANNTTRN